MHNGHAEKPVDPSHRVEDAIWQMRVGRPVVLGDGRAAVVVSGLELAEARTPHRPWRVALPTRLLEDGPAVKVEGGVIEAELPPATTPAALLAWIEEQAGAQRLDRLFEMAPARPAARAAVELCKLAGLLPVALIEPVPADAEAAERAVEPSLVLAHRRSLARSMRRVAEAPVPLADAEDARIIAYRSALGGAEQLAIVIGDADAGGVPGRSAPLCRLHSACYTGDLLGSLRCDCGDQLKGAIRRIAAEGGGVVLYLAQEGRGIGLVNKLRAYRLQDAGLDTVEANEHLGFASDERDWLMAAAILEDLGLERIRLLTNNPNKVEMLKAHGIDVVERVAHEFPPTRHNRRYLATKAAKSGHLLSGLGALVRDG